MCLRPITELTHIEGHGNYDEGSPELRQSIQTDRRARSFDTVLHGLSSVRARSVVNREKPRRNAGFHRFLGILARAGICAALDAARADMAIHGAYEVERVPEGALGDGAASTVLSGAWTPKDDSLFTAAECYPIRPVSGNHGGRSELLTQDQPEVLPVINRHYAR